MPQSDKHFDFAFGGFKFLEIFRRCGKHALLPVPGCLPLHTLQCSLFPSPCPINFYCLIPQECGGTQSPRRMVSVIKSYCHNPSLLKKCSAPIRHYFPEPERRKDRKWENRNISFPFCGILWAAVQTVCRFTDITGISPPPLRAG